jgi:putative endonuclease
MFNVYILQSDKNGKKYIGMTSKSVKERLKEHNEGKNKYTKNNRPFRLVYYEKGYCKSCALKRERFLKSGQGYYFIKAIEKNLI